MLVKEEMFVGPIGWVLRAAGRSRSTVTAAARPCRRRSGCSSAAASSGSSPRATAVAATRPNARAGIAWLALNGHAPVVPVAVLGTRRTGESVNRLPGLRRRLVVEFGAPIVVERSATVTGREALVTANDAIRTALADLVTHASTRTGSRCPPTTPSRERRPGLQVGVVLFGAVTGDNGRHDRDRPLP